MFIRVTQPDMKKYYFNATEICFIIEDGSFYTIVMRNGAQYHIEGELYIPYT